MCHLHSWALSTNTRVPSRPVPSHPIPSHIPIPGGILSKPFHNKRKRVGPDAFCFVSFSLFFCFFLTTSNDSRERYGRLRRGGLLPSDAGMAGNHRLGVSDGRTLTETGTKNNKLLLDRVWIVNFFGLFSWNWYDFCYFSAKTKWNKCDHVCMQ